MQSKKVFYVLIIGLFLINISGCYVCAGERIPLLKQKEIQPLLPSPSPR